MCAYVRQQMVNNNVGDNQPIPILYVLGYVAKVALYTQWENAEFL